MTNTAPQPIPATAAPLDESLVWEAPGPGQWMLDTTHHGRRPVTAYLRSFDGEAFERVSVMFARYGLPLERMETREVNDCTYIRPRGVGEGDSLKPPPPALVMKLVARLHPELRRRNRTAKTAWAERRWRDDVDQWFDHDRQIAVEANLAFAGTDLTALDDRSLVAHLVELTEHARALAIAGFEAHGGDMIPVGDYLAHCTDWGIDPGEAAALLQGASPASTATLDSLAAVRRAAAEARPPASLDELRALGDDCRAEVDGWLSMFGWRVVSSDDLDAVTLAEQPALHLPALIAAATAEPPATPDPTPVRQRVPVEQRALFDELLTEARYGMPLRDDSVGVRWNWPVGLLRRTLLEVGRRLVAAGRLQEPVHAVELAAAEVGPLLLDGRGPTADEAAGRLARRLAIEASEPPALLGPPEPPPPFDALPPAMARAARALLALIDAMEGKPARSDAVGAAPGGSTVDATDSDRAAGVVGRGTGIGTEPYEGPVRVVRGAAEALDRIEPGDVLVAPFTGPAYNAVLPLVGALVVEEGGPLCHAAIVAREFRLPAVIGAAGAVAALADGDRVRVDPAEGTITRVEPAH